MLPKEGATAWSDTWMISSKAKHPNCMYMWMNYITSPSVQAQVAEYFGEAPANPLACGHITDDTTFCDQYHVKDAAFAKKLWYWTTPTKNCLDGSGKIGLHGLHRVDPGLERPDRIVSHRGSGSRFVGLDPRCSTPTPVT